MSDASAHQLRLLEARAAVLDLIANDRPIDRVLTELCWRLESLAPPAVLGVCVLDRGARVFENAIFPSLGGGFAEAIKGVRVSDKPGSCALAIYKGETVTSHHIENDDRFHDAWRLLNREHGITCIQSRPVFSPGGISLGTFVIGHGSEQASFVFDEAVASLGVELSGIALTKYRKDQQNILLLGELQHRSRNMFTMVGAVVYSTLRGYPDPIAFRRVFDGRLAALSRAHSLGVGEFSNDLRTLLSDILAPHGSPPRVCIDGPQIMLTPEASVAFAVAANELATNAAKYGALSSDSGRVDISWQITEERGEPILDLMWNERDGPVVSVPKTSGFGRSAIEQSLRNAIDGEVTLEFPSSGVHCTIRAPLNDRLGVRPV